MSENEPTWITVLKRIGLVAGTITVVSTALVILGTFYTKWFVAYPFHILGWVLLTLGVFFAYLRKASLNAFLSLDWLMFPLALAQMLLLLLLIALCVSWETERWTSIEIGGGEPTLDWGGDAQTTAKHEDMKQIADMPAFEEDKTTSQELDAITVVLKKHWTVLVHLAGTVVWSLVLVELLSVRQRILWSERERTPE